VTQEANYITWYAA